MLETRDGIISGGNTEVPVERVKVITEVVRRLATQLELLSKQLHRTSNEEIVERLTNLLASNDSLRPMQVEAYRAILEHFQKGEYTGLVKKPTGSGKTRLFGTFIRDIQLPGLVLVPRVNLVPGTEDELIGSKEEKKSGIGFEERKIFTISSEEKGGTEEQLQKVLSNIVEKNIANPIIIMTYQSLVFLKKENPSLVNLLLAFVSIIISDEGHRSLGTSTKSATSYSEDEDINSPEIRSLIALSQKIHLIFTATPRLTEKDVRQYYPVIYNSTFIDAVNAGDIILPTRHTIPALIQREELAGYVDNLDNDAESLFIDKYIELKNTQPDGYFPGVFFCRDIHHAEAVRKMLVNRGLRAERVTSDRYDTEFHTKTLSPGEASQSLTNGDLDVITTVIKVAEGWDVPALRCAIPLSPIISPAKLIQGVGRIARTLPRELDYLGLKDSSNTIIIEPRAWISRSGSSAASKMGRTFFDAPPPQYTIEDLGQFFPMENSPDQRLSLKYLGEGLQDSSQQMLTEVNKYTVNSTKYTRLPTALEIMYLAGEIDANTMKSMYPDINISSIPRRELDENGELDIDDETYIYIGKLSSQNFPESIPTIRKTLANQGNEWKKENMIAFGGTLNGNFVDIYKKSALTQLLSERYGRDIALEYPGQRIIHFNDDYWYIGISNTPKHHGFIRNHMNALSIGEQNKIFVSNMFVGNKGRTKGDTGRQTVTLVNVRLAWKLITQFPQNPNKPFSIVDLCYKGLARSGKHFVHVDFRSENAIKDLAIIFTNGNIEDFITHMEVTVGRNIKNTCAYNKETGEKVTTGKFYTVEELDRLFLDFMNMVNL